MTKKKTTRNTYGEGSIFFSNVKQRWMAQVVVGKDANGKASPVDPFRLLHK